MEDKIKLIDIIENPLGLVENIVRDAINRENKYTYLFSTMLTKVIHIENPEIPENLELKIINIDRDLDINLFSTTEIKYNINLLNYLLDNNKDKITQLVNDGAFESEMEKKYKFTVNAVYDIDQELMSKVNVPVSDINTKRLKFIYMVIMMFIKSDYVKNARGLDKLIADILVSDSKILPYDIIYKAIYGVWIYKIGLINGKTYDFEIINNMPSLRWKMDIRNSSIILKDRIDDSVINIRMTDEFNADKCLCMPMISVNRSKNGPIYIDMEYIAEELEKVYNMEVYKYIKINKNALCYKSVGDIRLKETIRKYVHNDIGVNSFISPNEWIWILLSFKFKGLYKTFEWIDSLNKYKEDYAYFDENKGKVIIKNINDSIYERNLDYVNHVLERINNSVTYDKNNDEIENMLLFVDELMFDTLNLLEINKNDNSNANVSEFIRDIILTNHNYTNEYIYTVAENNGEWNIPLSNNEESILDEFDKVYAKNPSIEESIYNTINNLLEYQSRKVLFRLLVNANRYIFDNYLSMGCMYEPTDNDYKLVLSSVDKIDIDDGKIAFLNKKRKYVDAYDSVNRTVNRIMYNSKETCDIYNKISHDIFGRYKEMGILYYIMKDLLYTYICLIICNKLKLSKDRFFKGLVINGYEAMFIDKSNKKIDIIREIQNISKNNDAAMQFKPMSECDNAYRDKQLRDIGYNPENIPFNIRYKEDLTTDMLDKYEDSKYEVLPLPLPSQKQKETNMLIANALINGATCTDEHEITHGETYTVTTHNAINDEENRSKSLENAFDSIRSLLSHNDKLEDMWVKQVCFDEMTFSRNNTNRESTRKDRYLALMVELGEVLKEDECYKYWKNGRHTIESPEYKEKAKEEFADLMHFVMSVGIDLYDSVDELYEYFIKKHNININRQHNNY